MIERLLCLKPALDAMSVDNKLGGNSLNPDDWTVLNDVKTILEPFQICQKQLEGDK
jgi:hypothetical protein